MKRFQKGQFNMNDLKGQLEQMQKMGGMQGMMGMMPGMAKMQKQIDDAGFDDKVIKRQIALINSMTKKERANPELLQASRKKRIAAGAGQEVGRPQQAAQDAPPDGRRDEEDGQDGQEGPDARRPRRAAGQGRRHARRHGRGRHGRRKRWTPEGAWRHGDGGRAATLHDMGTGAHPAGLCPASAAAWATSRDWGRKTNSVTQALPPPASWRRDHGGRRSDVALGRTLPGSGPLSAGAGSHASARRPAGRLRVYARCRMIGVHIFAPLTCPVHSDKQSQCLARSPHLSEARNDPAPCGYPRAGDRAPPLPRASGVAISRCWNPSSAPTAPGISAAARTRTNATPGTS